MPRNAVGRVTCLRIGKIPPILILLFVSLTAAAQDFVTESYGVNVTTNIQYGTGSVLPSGSVNLFLDLYEPTGAGVPALKPGFVLVHGGGWSIGDKAVGSFSFGPGLDGQEVAVLATELAKRGYVCISINYRMYGDNPAGSGLLNASGQTTIVDIVQDLFPALTDSARIVRSIEAAVDDTVNACQWLMAQSGPLGVDPSRIAVGGYSAGAYNSFLAAYGAGAGVKAVWMNSGGLGDNSDFATPGGPPTIAFHGAVDQVVPVTEGQAVNTALGSVGVVCDYFEMPGEDHFYNFNTVVGSPAKAGGTIEEEIVNFMYTHLELATIGSPSVPTTSFGLSILLMSILLVVGVVWGIPRDSVRHQAK